MSEGFNPDEPRDDHGRWTGEGGVAVQVARDAKPAHQKIIDKALGHAGFKTFLEQPGQWLGRIKMDAGLAGANVLGGYNPENHDISITDKKVKIGRAQGKAYTVAEMAKSQDDAKERMIFHEAMHHVHMSSDLDNPNAMHQGEARAVRDDLYKSFFAAKKVGGGIGEYARENMREYVAETSTAYRYESATLLRVDPAGHAAVARMFKHVGLE